MTPTQTHPGTVVALFPERSEPAEYHLVADHVMGTDDYRERQGRAQRLIAWSVGMSIVVRGREATVRALRSILRGIE